MAANTVVIFGDSGLYKTTNAGYAAKYIYEKTGGKITRYIAADPGGYRPNQPLVEAGIIEPVGLVEAKNPLVSMRKLSTGYWPGQVVDGRVVGDRWLPPTPETWERVGAYVVDTITSVCDLYLEDLRSKGRAIGQDVVGRFAEEDEKFGASPPSHFGFVQREMLARMRSFAALPVDLVIFLAHEAKGEESDSRLPIRGPALAGTAATDRVPKEVGDCIHFESYSEEIETVDPATKAKIKHNHTRVRAFFMSHPDPRIPGVLYKCKPRVPPEVIPDLLKRWPGGYFEPTIQSGLDEFLRLEDELLARSSDHEKKWREEIDAKIRAARAA